MHWDIIQGRDIPSNVIRYTLAFQVEHHSSYQGWQYHYRRVKDGNKKVGLGFSWVKHKNQRTGHTGP